MDGGVRSTATR